MTDLSTSNLKRLLDQATPGPWEYEGPKFQEITAQDSDGLEQSVINPDRYTEREFCNRPADFELAALAPELAQEVLRLRAGVEKIMEMCLLERDAAFQDAPMRAGEVTAFNLCAERLTDLLNGDTE